MDNIYTIARPFLLVLKIFGLISLTFKGSAFRGKIEFNIFDKINMTAKLILVIFLLVGDINYHFKVDDPTITTVSWNLTAKLSVALVVLSLLYQWKKHNSIISFIHLLHKIDVQVIL